MSPTEFKTGIKGIKENLRGKTLQIVNPHSAIPYFTLKEFGNAILNEEKNGNSFSISQAWTNDGVVIINSINHLAELLVSKTITGIQFRAYYAPKDFAESIRLGYTLND